MSFLPKHPENGELHLIAEQTIFQGNRFETVEKILAWLIREDIIKPEKCIVRHQQNGHRFSEGIKRVVMGPLPDLTSDFMGLEYCTERFFYSANHPDFHGILCPNCNSNLEDSDEYEDVWWQAIKQWEEHDGIEYVVCPVCGSQVPFHKFRYGIDCGFSDLAFTFFGCRGFTEVFQAEFERHLGCPVRLVWNYYV